MKKALFLFLLPFVLPLIGFAQSDSLSNFIVKENLLKNDKLAIIATDSLESPIETINGTYSFSINGFKQELLFHDGVAVAPMQIAKSAFVFLKFHGPTKNKAKLYYVIKRESGLNPIKINWMMLVIIPVIIIAFASMFRKFIIAAVIVIIGLMIFNSQKGLDIHTFTDTIWEGLKGIILH